jgi:hypothetical protein
MSSQQQDDAKTKASSTQSVAGRSFEQPSPEVCSQPGYVVTALLEMAGWATLERKRYSAKTTIRRVQEQSLRRTLTPNSLRLHHHHLLLLCDRPLRLRPRRVLVEGSRRHLPSDQVSPSQGVPDTFQSWSHGTATPGEQLRGAWPRRHGLANDAELPFRALRITLRFSCCITPRWVLRFSSDMASSYIHGD